MLHDFFECGRISIIEFLAAILEFFEAIVESVDSLLYV